MSPVTHRPGDELHVESRVVKDVDGVWRVLFQIPAGYVTMRPDDARKTAKLLMEMADAADDEDDAEVSG